MNPVDGITTVLEELRDRPELFDQKLIPLLYPYMRQLAANRLRGWNRGFTLRPTEVVHEAYVRLKLSGADTRSRLHLMACVGKVTRDILVDHARHRKALKRGREVEKVNLEDWNRVANPRPLSFDANASERPVSLEEILAVHNALMRLESIRPAWAKALELKFFGGLTAEEVAEVQGVAKTTAKDRIQAGSAWIKREMEKGPG